MRRRIQSLYRSRRENKLDFNFHIEFPRIDSVLFIANTVVYVSTQHRHLFLKLSMFLELILGIISFFRVAVMRFRHAPYTS